MSTKITQVKKRQFVKDNSIEALLNIGSAMVDQIKGDYNEQKSQGGDLTEGQEIELKKSPASENREKARQMPDIDPGIDYKREILRGERAIIQENSREIEVKIQEIIIELKRLTQTSTVLQAEFKEVTVEQRIEKPGKYHLSFFEWVLIMVRAARVKVEDSGAWLEMFKSKKAQKQYWNMFKKHGTTFGLSNERVVATQTG